uniref:Smp_204810 n=2 Tax=Schistosoma mansoni TaxID=6183 RepID=A0A5K4FFJ7_SCHMA
MLFKQHKQVNNWKSSPNIDLIKFFIVTCLPLIEMIITTILICKFCHECKNINQYKWYLIGLIPSSIIFSLLMVIVRDMRARFPLNYVFLFLNTLLLCYTFIPPILMIMIKNIMISFTVATVIAFSMIVLGMFIKVKIPPVLSAAVSISFIIVGLAISVGLYLAQKQVALQVMGAFFILSILPILLFVGQQLRTEYSPRMLPSDYILYAVLMSAIYLFIFYSISVQFLNHRHESTPYSC